MEALKRAIECVGGVGKLANAIGVGQSAISNLVTRGGEPSPASCVAIERVTGGEVSRRDLRPDDWHLIWPELVDAADEPLVQAAKGEPTQAEPAGATVREAEHG